MIYSIAIENTFNNNITKKIVDLSTISPSTITDPTVPYIEYVSDQKERLDGYVYLPLYKRNQFCIIPPNSVLTVETENSDEAIFYVSQKLEFSKITSNPDPITGILYNTSLFTTKNNSVITKQTIKDYLNRTIDIDSVPEGITTLGDGAFGNCKNITEISIPEGITSIGKNCFSGCSNLKNISLPESLREIGKMCFTNCSELESIEIPNTVTKINSDAFRNCTKLKTVNIPTSITGIDNGTFEGCTSLETIYIPSNITTIGYSSFNKCKNLKDIYIAKNQGSITGSPWGATNATIHWNS